MDVTVEVKGLQQFEARLLELEALGGQKLLRRVLRRVAKPLLQRARANAQSIGRSGALWRSMTIVTKREQGRQAALVATTSKGRERTALRMHNEHYSRHRKGVYYGWMVDQGHRVGTRRTGYLKKFTRPRGAGGHAAGTVRAHPWWTPAVTASEPAMVSAMTAELAAALKRIERRSAPTPSPDAVVPE